MVLAEGLAAGVPIVAASSGAIPEVLGASANLFAPGDWLDLARRLAALRTRRADAASSIPERVARYSSAAAAARIAAAYERLLAP